MPVVVNWVSRYRFFKKENALRFGVIEIGRGVSKKLNKVDLTWTRVSELRVSKGKKRTMVMLLRLIRQVTDKGRGKGTSRILVVSAAGYQ